MRCSYLVLVVLFLCSSWVTGAVYFGKYCRQFQECVCVEVKFENESAAFDPDSRSFECDTLVFMNSTIPRIPENTFVIATEVKDAYLTYDGIEHLRKLDFKGAGKLKKLDLDANLLQEVNNEVFSYASELRILKLSFNKIHWLEEYAFHKLEKLEELYLNGNTIKYLKEKLFADTMLLRVLDLQDNEIEVLPQHLFKNNLNMEVLNLGNNKLKIVAESPREITFRFLQPLENLQKLSLSGNQASFIPQYALEPLPNLVELDLSRLGVTRIERQAFNNQRRLTHLDLGYNHLRVVHVGLFSSLKSLRTLSLRGNLLSKIDIRAFVAELNSTRIDLMKNLFSCFIVDQIVNRTTLAHRNLQDFMSYWEEEADFDADCAAISERKDVVIPSKKDADPVCSFLNAISQQLAMQDEEFTSQFGLLRKKLEEMEGALDMIYREVKPKSIFA